MRVAPIATHHGTSVMEYFFRKAYFWPEGNRTDEAPQLRAYIAWSSK